MGHDKISLILRSGLAMDIFEENAEAPLNIVTTRRWIFRDLHILH